jgi:hypothetical protein
MEKTAIMRFRGGRVNDAASVAAIFIMAHRQRILAIAGEVGCAKITILAGWAGLGP